LDLQDLVELPGMMEAVELPGMMEAVELPGMMEAAVHKDLKVYLDLKGRAATQAASAPKDLLDSQDQSARKDHKDLLDIQDHWVTQVVLVLKDRKDLLDSQDQSARKAYLDHRDLLAILAQLDLLVHKDLAVISEASVLKDH
jgi:hypothetical protein